MPGSSADSRPTSGFASPGRIRSRAHSISSDRPSTVGHHSLTIPPPTASPEPAFIAASAAAQIVTNDHDSHADAWYDQNGLEPSDEPVYVSDRALELVNGFLDQLLFNFLQVSRSTTLTSLRPAVIEILKPKLAKDTIANADEELREYLGGADEDDYVQPQGTTARGWDLELVWKRTRLRCMVYSSLGDMEEEDEDMYMEQEDLEVGVDEQISDVISPAVAIFLTSVVEYMGELTLTVAGQAAYHRVRSKVEKELKDGSRQAGDMADRIIIEELDMERVALDRTLGRLWRGWKKRLRGPGTDSTPRPFSRGSSGHARNDSLGNETMSPKDASHDFRKSQEQKGDTIVEDVQPADIPLPLRDNDVDEIEVPGLIFYSDDESEAGDEDDEPMTARPKSFYLTSPVFLETGVMTPFDSQPHTPIVMTRKRANSLPSPAASPFFAFKMVSLDQELQADEEANRSEEDAEAVEADAKNEGEAEGEAEEAEKTEKPQGLGLVSKPKPAAVRDGEHEWDSDASEEVAYEKAEVMTSSRVSVDSSPSPARSDSDSGKRGHRARTSSVHSARIIDVHGPKSPIGSRPGSGADHRRSASLTSAVTPRSVPDPIPVPQASEDDVFSQPSERMRAPRRSTTAISESEEESDYHSARGKLSLTASGSTHTRSSGDSERRNAPAAGMQPSTGPKPKTVQTVSPVIEQTGSETSVGTRRQTTPKLSPIVTKPEVPRRAPGHTSSPRQLSGLSPNLERIRTAEYEEGSASPNSIAPPRHIHTSGSSNSSATGRLKAVRTSEDNSSTSRSESVARNFEELIQSNQTITYTLTPESMRDIDSKRSMDSPVVTKLSRKSEEARSPNPSRPSPTVSASPSTFRGPGFNNTTIVESSEPSPSGPIPRAPPGMALSTGKFGGPQARDARVPAGSTADFAEFIKSTGPAVENRHVSVRNVTGPGSNSPTSPTLTPGRVVDPRRVSTAGARSSRFQPRDATVASKDDSRDLIDFIRQGPPIAATNSTHRIPRHVAPFRTTMDSDQMSGVSGGRAVDASIPDIRNSHASTNHTENSMPSVQSSVNSNSALIKNRAAGSKAANMMGEEDVMPKRKTRRVRDPYALDFSDEEEDEEMGEPSAAPVPAPVRAPAARQQPPVKREESLAEFLRNYDPPAEPASPRNRVPKKKASAPSLIGRLTRGGREKSDTASIIEARSLSSRAGTVRNDDRSLSSRAGGGKGGYIPIQVNMPPGYDKYGPIDTAAARPRMSSQSSGSRRVPMKKFEPREAATYKSETSELAAFLRDSAPPPSNSPAPMRPPTRQEESTGLSKMFSRRKKTAMA